MADDTVLIKIGATTVDLTAGVNQAKSAIEELRSPVDSLQSSLRGLAEVTGAAFAFETIVDWTREIAAAAEKLDIMAEAIGTTSAKLSEFENILKLAGGESGNFVRIMATIGTSLEKAINEPLSTQASAADKAKIKLSELQVALKDPIDTIELLRQAWNNLAGDSNRLEIFKALVGSPRLFQSLIPYLELTNEELEKLRQKSEQTGANLSQTEVKSLRGIAEDVNTLQLAFDGLKTHIILSFKDPINDALVAATKFIESLKDNIPTAKKVMDDFWQKQNADAREAIGYWHDIQDAWAWFNKKWDDIQESLGHGRPGGTTADLPPGQSASAALPPPGSNILLPDVAVTADAVKENTDAIKSNTDSIGRTGRGSVFGNAPGWVDASDKGNQASGVPVAGHPGIALYDRSTLGQWFVVTGPDGRQFVLPQTDVGPAPWTGRSIDINAAAAGGVMGYTQQNFPTDKTFGYRPATAEEQARGESQIGKVAPPGGGEIPDFKDKKKAYDQELANIELEIQKALHDKDYAAAEAAIEKKRGLMESAKEDATKIAGEIQKVEERAADEKIRLAEEASQAALRQDARIEQAELAHAAATGKIQNQTAAQIAATERQIVSDHEAAQAAIIEQEMAMAGITREVHQKLEEQLTQIHEKAEQERTKITDKYLEEQAADAKKIDDKIASDFSQIFDAALSGNKAGIGQAIDRVLRSEIEGMIGNVFKSAVESSGIGQMLSGTVLGKLFGGTGNIFSGGGGGGASGGLFSGIGGWLGGLFGGGAGAGAAAGGGGLDAATEALGALMLFDRGGIVPTAQGGWSLPSFSGMQLAGLHANEMVLPSGISQGLQSMIASGGGGHTVNVYSQAMDGPSAHRAIMALGPSIVASINKATRLGSSLNTA